METLKTKKAELEKTAQDVAGRAYQQAQQAQQAQQGADSSNDKKDDNVVDADFSDVN